MKCFQQKEIISILGNEYEKLALDKDIVATTEVTTAAEISSGYKSNNQKDLMRMIRTAVDDKK